MLKWFGGKGRGNRGRQASRAGSFRPSVEGLEERSLLTAPAITLPLGTSVNVPVFVKTTNGTSQYFGKSIIVPIATDAAESTPISFTVQEVDADGNILNTPNPNMSVVRNTSTQYLRLTLQYTDANGDLKTGVMEFELLPDLAPNLVARFIDLANKGYFNNTVFHRVAVDSTSPTPLALALQAGQNGAGFTIPGAINDEFTISSLFTGSGQLALAKSSADDSGTSQFFITTNGAGSTASTSPQRDWSLNYPIFGQLVRGFDVRDELVALPRTVTTPGTATFNNAVTIKTAEIVTNKADDVITIRATGAAPGVTTRYLITASDGTDSSSTLLTVTTVADTTNDAPFLGPVPSPSTVAGQPVTFTLSATDLENDPLTYTVTGISPGGTASVNGNQVTVTPPARYVGPITFTVAVSDPTHPSADTQPMSITVNYSVPINLPADERFLIQVYRDVLGRDPDAAGHDYYLGRMAGGMSHQGVASALLNSTEGRTRAINTMYQNLLGRPVDQGGLRAWLNYLNQGGTLTKLRAQIMGSDEYFSQVAGGNNSTYVTFAYLTITGQIPDQTTQQNYLALLTGGTPRSVVAYQMMATSAGWQNLAGATFQDVLNRSSDSAGANYYSALLASWQREEEVRAQMYGSGEYQSGIF